MSYYTSAVVTFITGLATGLISGFLIQQRQFNDNQKTSKLSRLLPFMEHAYSKVERLKEHSEYAYKVQNDDADFTNVLYRVTNALDEYEIWFTSFKEEGMIPELSSVNRELLDHLVGIANFSYQKRRYGIIFISQNIDDFSKLCVSSENLLRRWLKTGH
jgi:hypothetical protein